MSTVNALSNAEGRGGLLRWLASREPLPSVNASLAWTGLSLGVLAPIVIATPLGSLVKTLVTLAFICFGPGPAFLCRIRLGSASVSWAISLVLSMSVFALPAAVMVWTAFWHPFFAFYALAGLSVAAALVGLSPTILARTALGQIAESQRSIRRESFVVPAEIEDATTIMPKIVDGGDATAIMPKARGNGSDATEVMPALGAGVGSMDSTAILPRQRVNVEADSTRVFAAVGDIEESAASPERDATQLFAAVRAADDTAIFHMPDDWQIRDLLLPADDATTPEPRFSRAVVARLAKPGRTVVVEILLFAAALTCWVASLLLSNTAAVGSYGLLSVMHPTFFVGIALCVAGFALEIAYGARRGWLLLANLALMLLILHATVPILVTEPEYAWTYRHVGVIQLFRTSGRVVNPDDIYQAWPTFFAAVAQLGSVAGASSLRIAAWAPVFFDAANCLQVYAIVRSITTDRRLPYLTVFVFTCVNWVAQDYLSPQAFAFLLCLGTMLIMVRWLRRKPGPTGVRFQPLARLWPLLHEGLATVPYVAKRTEWAALASLYFIYEIVVISHQLSPYLIALSAMALVMLGLIRTWQVVPIFMGIAVLYLLPHYGVVDRYGVFDGINIFHNLLHGTQGVSPATGVSSTGQIFSAEIVQLLSLALWGAAAIAVVASRHRLGPVALPAVFAFAPFFTLLGQDYGGEAIYRVYLFSSPWCAYLVCRLALQLHRIPKAVGIVGATLVVSAAALVGIQGEHGQLSFDQYTTTEVQAAEYAYAHAPKGTMLISAVANMPERLSQRYVYIDAGSDPITLMDVLPPDRATITDADMVKIDNFCSELNAPVYLVIMQSMINYAHYFGYLPDGQLANLETAVNASPYWIPVFTSSDAMVYRFDV